MGTCLQPSNMDEEQGLSPGILHVFSTRLDLPGHPASWTQQLSALGLSYVKIAIAGLQGPYCGPAASRRRWRCRLWPMGPSVLPTWLQPRYRKNVYLFIYYLIQFCGHSWILTNMTARFFSFGKDSMVDTFYAIGLVMRVCQSISLLELLHIYIGIETNHLFPKFLQLTERVVILFGVITSQEEIQEKYVVCVLFIFWNLLDMVRYTYSMLSVIGISYAVLTWLSQTLWMPIYPLCVLAEAFTIYQSLPYFESFGTNSTVLAFDISTCFPYVLKLYLLVLFIGMYFTYSHLYTERKDVLRVISAKQKKM